MIRNSLYFLSKYKKPIYIYESPVIIFPFFKKMKNMNCFNKKNIIIRWPSTV